MPTVDPQLRHLSETPDTQWRLDLRDAVSDVDELLQLVGLSRSDIRIDPHNAFRLRVPRAFVSLMQHGDPEDPLLRQVLPTASENEGGGLLDPVEDLGAASGSGLLQKYHGRALMITTGACAVHCRYCFRRHFPYSTMALRQQDITDSIARLREDPDTDEIILSGGDPLMLDDERLADLLAALASAENLRYLRLHSRLPLVLPTRINSKLLQLLASTRFRVTLVIHANHANELGPEQEAVLASLRECGVTLLNQSVLLRGINDDTETLAALSKRLHDCFTLPYYLHLLDPVQGAMHFDVPETEARKILTDLQGILPGYLVPKLVREVPNSTSKTAISLD